METECVRNDLNELTLPSLPRGIRITSPEFTNNTLRLAVALYLNNPQEAEEKYGPINKWNTRNVTDMSYLFENAVHFNARIGGWDTRNVQTMRGMFNDAENFNQWIGSWNVSQVTDMSHMFHGASSFNKPINTVLSAGDELIYNHHCWDASYYSQNIFEESDENFPLGFRTNYVKSLPDLNNLNMNDWYDEDPRLNNNGKNYNFVPEPISDVHRHMANPYRMKFIRINGWNVTNVKDMSFMFADAVLFDQPLSEWNTHNVRDMNHMFYNATMFNSSIQKWNTKKVQNMSYMFAYTLMFNQPIAMWNVSSVENMDYMFYDALNFNQYIQDWFVRTDYPVRREMFGTVLC
jgi:hypothetical protein